MSKLSQFESGCSRSRELQSKHRRDEISQRKRGEDGKLASYQQKRCQVRSHDDGVASDSDADEVESSWKPIEHKINPYAPGMRAERLAKDDLRAECEEDEYLDAMYDDPEDQLEEVLGKDSDNDSKEELEEDSMENDDCEDDDESNESDD
ncbi:nucleolar transcription factor 1-B-like [Papaver somniferum]|uniref:nucleolar transcription factor 1-B-like n=1 Tax=Papaver somniferum TaxID=3469 RepID=UPI000E70583E|nr:nucleolar transcription factor 1-B-like [Papaver somniferum]